MNDIDHPCTQPTSHNLMKQILINKVEKKKGYFNLYTIETLDLFPIQNVQKPQNLVSIDIPEIHLDAKHTNNAIVVVCKEEQRNPRADSEYKWMGGREGKVSRKPMP